MGWGLSCALFQIPNLTGPSSWWEQVSQGSGKSLGTKRLSGGRMCLLRLASNLKGLSWRWRHRVQFLKFFFFFFLTRTGPKSIDQSTNQPINPSQALLPTHYPHPPLSHVFPGKPVSQPLAPVSRPFVQTTWSPPGSLGQKGQPLPVSR